MKLYPRLVMAALISCTFVLSAHAQLHWDIDAIDQLGAGGATPSGVWDVGTTPNWNVNSDGSGVPGVWSDFNDAVFAAGGDATGSYTVTLDGTVSPNSIAFEEAGSVVTITGGTSLDVLSAIDVADGARAVVDSVMGGFSMITKNGNGTLDLTNANTFGGMQLSAGTVRVNNITALGAASSSVVILDGTTLATTTGTARVLTYAFSTAGNFTLGQSSGGTGTVNMAGTFDLAGGERTITVNSPSATISAVTSNGGLIKEGTGTLTLSGANTYVGAVTVNAGILASSNTSGLGTSAGGVTVNSGATLQVSGGNTQTDAIVLNGTGSTGSNGALRKTGNNTTRLNGNLSGSGSIEVTAGTLRLAATGTPASSGFTGPITVTNSTLQFEFISPSQLGPTGVITLNGGTLHNLNSSSPGNGSMLPSGRTLSLGANGGTLHYDTVGGLSIVNPTSTISGTGGLTKTGVGIVAVAAPATYGGPTHVVAGTLRVRTSNERFPNGSALTVDLGATFDVANLTETIGSLEGAGTLSIGTGQFNVGGNNGSTTFSGQFTGSNGKVTKQGTGTFTVTGDNIQAGLTTVSNGTLLVNNLTGSGTGTGPVTVAAAGKLGGTGTVAGAITNNGTITPGDGVVVGTLNTGSNVINGANSHWAIELDGASSDQLAVGGDLDLSAVDFLDITGSGTGPWTIATYAGSLSGIFDNVTSGYTVDYSTGGQIILNSAGAGLPGDYNSDGKVDAGDYVTWRKNGEPNTAGTGSLANDGGSADQNARFSLWRANFGNPPGAGSGGGLGGAAVPEPSAMVLMLVGVAIAYFCRGRRAM